MPATRSVPLSGGSNVATAFTNVVLPAPFGPSTAVTFPRRGNEVEPVEGVHGAVVLRGATGLDGGDRFGHLLIMLSQTGHPATGFGPDRVSSVTVARPRSRSGPV